MIVNSKIITGMIKRAVVLENPRLAVGKIVARHLRLT